MSKKRIFKFSFSACWSRPCLAAFSPFSTTAFDNVSTLVCHAGDICEEIRGLTTGGIVDCLEEDGVKEDDIDEDDASA
jgi:hypothetical protein